MDPMTGSIQLLAAFLGMLPLCNASRPSGAALHSMLKSHHMPDAYRQDYDAYIQCLQATVALPRGNMKSTVAVLDLRGGSIEWGHQTNQCMQLIRNHIASLYQQPFICRLSVWTSRCHDTTCRNRKQGRMCNRCR